MKRLIATVAALVGILALVPTALAAGPAPDTATAKYEVRFLTDMIDHHAMAVEMGELCIDSAEHAELVAMCESIVASQSAQIETMQSWLADWYGVSHEPEMTPGMMAQMDRLASLEGDRFEITFMKRMIRHHWQAIVEGEGCLDRAWHPELKSLCSDIIAAQAAEIRQMQAWLCDWYDVCGYFSDRRFAA